MLVELQTQVATAAPAAVVTAALLEQEQGHQDKELMVRTVVMAVEPEVVVAAGLLLLDHQTHLRQKMVVQGALELHRLLQAPR